MGKRKSGIVVAVLLLVCMLPLVRSASVPFTVYGYTNRTNIQVAVTNARTHESLVVTTDGVGMYMANLGNMQTSWDRGDTIFVNASYASTSFFIPSTGYLYRQDVISPNSVDYLSNRIETTITVIGE